jgi:hypothetical protein
VTPQIAEKPTDFRLALAPSIVNPRYNRLWLIPADQSAGFFFAPNPPLE